MKSKNNPKVVERGDVYFADFPNTIGSEQSGIRPIVIIQNNIGNKFSPTVIAAAITSRSHKHHLPTHVWIGNLPGSWTDSIVLTEQIKTLDKKRLRAYVTKLDSYKMGKIDRALEISIGLNIEQVTNRSQS
ncbi:MAG: type II toxin-antitoxin system PemK/MazF family toxin [Oscillospiraceae bacterium]|nr:type II toxin-antitoxin system PemK/MazF family toxin [Oscillospiraceae bacterium]